MFPPPKKKNPSHPDRQALVLSREENPPLLKAFRKLQKVQNCPVLSITEITSALGSFAACLLLLG